MKAELIGSVLIYMIYVVVPRRYRIPALLGFAILLPIVTQRSNFAAFGLGALLQEAWSDRRLPFVMPSLLLIVGLLIGSQGTGFSERVGLTFLPEQLKLGNKVGMLYPIGATLIVYACLVSERLAQALSSSSCRFLGRISFGLYLVHVPLLMTVFASVALMLEPLSPAVIALGLPVVLAAAVAAGWLMTIAVDEPLLRMLARLRSRSRTEDALQGRSSGLTVQEPVGDRATKAALDQATSHLEAIRFFDKLLASKRSHRPQRQ